jgi:hypothetical protein
VRYLSVLGDAGMQQGALANQILGVGLKFDNDEDSKT